MKIVMLNGPPRSGKDEAVKALAKEFNIRHYKMSYPLKRTVRTFWNLTDDEEKYLEAHKEDPQKIFAGRSYRQVQISLSEDWAKPVFGSDVFGIIARRALSIPTDTQFTVISDSGFFDEAVPLVRLTGPRSVLLIHISRPGTSFENDSRSYIELEQHGVTTVHVDNHYPDTFLYHTKIVGVVRSWLGEDAGGNERAGTQTRVPGKS